MNKIDEGINYIKNTGITKKEELYKLVLSSLKEEELCDDWLKIYNKYKNIFPDYYNVHKDYEKIKNKVKYN